MPGEIELQWPTAVDRERRLQLDASGLSQEEFVLGSVQHAGLTREGLLLPAPSRVAFEVTIPTAGVLTFEPGNAEPEVADLAPSDGCTLQVRFDSELVYESTFTPGRFGFERLDLSSYAGRSGLLTFESVPGNTSTNDLCFVGGPVLHAMAARPRRVVLVFLDTVRADHLGMYGYTRDTTPRLDVFAEEAVVFDQARSIAPWTLPSARTALTGRHPESWPTPMLQEILRDQGFSTGMISGNVFLTSNFGMSRGWDWHHASLQPPADRVTNQAIDWLALHEGQDVLLQVHHMSAHLPYREPKRYRRLREAPGASDFPDIFRVQHVRARTRTHTLGDPAKAWIGARYDQSLRWLDDEVSRLLEAVGDDAIVVLYSDHGEELWEHGGHEHGHALWDEVLRVPIVLRAPGLPIGRVQEPVSLLDLTPTVLDLLDISGPPMEGSSLVPLVHRETVAQATFQDRPVAVGRLLYGPEAWGLLRGMKKWTLRNGISTTFDLLTDPGEASPVEGVSGPLQKTFEDVWGAPLMTVGRVITPSSGTPEAVELELEIPGELTIWAAPSPHAAVATWEQHGQKVRIRWDAALEPHEVYIQSDAPLAEVRAALPDTPHLDVQILNIAPPVGSTTTIDSESIGALKALGYMD